MDFSEWILYVSSRYKPAIDFFGALLTPAIGIAVTYIAYQQYKTNSQKFKLDIYEKRLSIFKKIRRILSIIFKDAKISFEELLEFRTSVAESDFLFGSEITEYIEQIYSRGLSLVRAREQFSDLPRGDERNRLVAENSEHLGWLTDQLPILKTKFNKYLSLKS
jgi:hypothetical protein